METRTEVGGAATAPREEWLRLARQREGGVLPVWLLYEEDHYETVSGDGFGLMLDFATPDRDEAHEIARAREAVTDWHVFHIYRAELRAGAGGALEVAAVELDSTVPGCYSHAHDVRLTWEELERALAAPRIVESGWAWRGARRAEPLPAPGPGLGRPFETPVRVIEGQLEMIERDLGFVERQAQRYVARAPEWSAVAAGACAAWRSAVAAHGRPGVERLRALLAAGESPREALVQLQRMEEAPRAYHAAVTALQAAARQPDAPSEVERLDVLVAESGANYLWAWLRIQREMAEIARLWRAGRSGGATAGA